MSLTEKTLELNITHELLVLGQGMTAIFWAKRPLTGPTPPPGPPIYAAGLSLKEEHKCGWDVSVELPMIGATPSQIVFLQFKLGKRRERTRKKNSIFAESQADTAHILFEINNNTGMNQHSRLRRTARAFGKPKSAIYVLPLVTSTNEARNEVGRLIARTAFVTVPAIDLVARPAISDGRKRHIAVDPFISSRLEVRSEPALVEDEIGGRLIGEITAVRLHREMATWRDAFIESRATSRTSSDVGRSLARPLAGWLAYCLDVPESEMLGALGIPPASEQDLPTDGEEDGSFEEFVQYEFDPGEGPFDELLDDDQLDVGEMPKDARLMEISDVVRPLFQSLLSGDWLESVPTLPPLELLSQVDGERVAKISMEAGDDRKASRLGYLVI